jgi:hypothetical protein
MARAMAAELAVLWYALFSWRRAAPANGFTAYKRAGWVAIYAAFALGADMLLLQVNEPEAFAAAVAGDGNGCRCLP